MPPTMPSKSKVREEEEEDVSQLRKPITIHGKPVEQILNSIHYGSPELRSLLLNECDIIFECKVCRALFRDLPNFIAHKRRFCSKSAAENNYFAISELPDEKVVVVQPRAPAETKLRSAKTSAQLALSSSSGKSLEETVQRIGHGDGQSHAFKVYSNAEAKLRHQRDHAKISSIRTTEIPGNSNAVFVSVNSTSVNIHERAAMSNVQENTTKGSSSARTNSRKGEARSRSLERPNLRSKSSNKTEDDTVQPTDILMKELKVMQNRLRNRTQCPKEGKEVADQDSKEKLDTGTQDVPEKELSKRQKEETKERLDQETKEAKACTTVDSCHSKHRSPCEKQTGECSGGNNSINSSENSSSRGSVGTLQQNTAFAVIKIEKDLSEIPSKSSINVGSTLLKTEGKHSKRSLICMKCRSIFSSKKSLQFHMKMQHSGNKTFFPCPLCSNIYCYLQAVRRHLQINHNKSKLQIKALQGEIKSRVFSKFAPSQSQESVRSAKRTLSGTRHSLRYKDKALNKKLNNAPYLYSLVKKSKGVSAKKDPILQSSSERDLSSESSESSPPPKPNSLQVQSGHHKKREDQRSHIKSTHSLAKGETPEIKSESKSLRHHMSPENDVPTPVVKLSICLDSEMQTCKKCSRLFGRKATFEKHVKLCEGKPNATAPGVNVERKLTRHDTGINSVSTRNKSKEDTSSGSSVSSTNEPSGKPLKSNLLTSSTSPSLSKPPADSRSPSLSKTENSTSSHDVGTVLSLDTPQLQGKYRTSSKCDALMEDESKRISDESESSRSTLDISATVTRLKSKLSYEYSKLRSEVKGQVAASDASSSSDSKGLGTDKCLSDSDCGKGRTSSVVMQSHGMETDLYEDTTLSTVSSVLERPRRKRKVPSRNIGAVEFLKKIHRLDDDNSQSPKSARAESVENSRTLQRTSNQQRKNDAKSKTLMKNTRDKRSFPSSVCRNRATGNRVFVLRSNDIGGNRSKLHCYNYSKVQKLMDKKNIVCLKCGAKFSFIHNLKRHIVRVHLQWSRFQCKLCNFNCFDKSECNTHIIRCHRKGQKPERNHYFNTLIIDLAQRGNEALSLKKTKAIKAKSQLQENEKDIYRNQNAQKKPRLSERTTPRADNAPPLSGDREMEKHRIQSKGECKRETMTNGVSSQSPTAQTVTVQGRHSPARQTISQKISHLVVRTSKVSSPHSVAITAMEENPEEESNIVATGLNSKLLGKEQVALKSISVANQATLTSTSTATIKKSALPFNISTRNSPRVFDTTPYNREEAVAVKSNDNETTPGVVLITRHGSYTKPLPSDPVKEKSKLSPASLPNGGVPGKKENSQLKEEFTTSDQVECSSDNDDIDSKGVEKELIAVESTNTSGDFVVTQHRDKSSATVSRVVREDVSVSASSEAELNSLRTEVSSVPVRDSAKISNTKTLQQDLNSDPAERKREILPKESSS